MTFVQAIQSGFKNYVKFTGRATRSEYWWFILFYVLCMAIPYTLFIGEVQNQAPGLGGVLLGLVFLVFFLPSLSLMFRRLHDTNRSAWWILLEFIPLGPIVVFVFTVLAGTKGPNKYGDDPKGAVATIAKTFE